MNCCKSNSTIVLRPKQRRQCTGVKFFRSFEIISKVFVIREAMPLINNNAIHIDTDR
jgi:hypothetical protein